MEQQPHVEILSRNKVDHSRITFLVAAIPVSVFSVVAAIALLPYLTIIAISLLVLAAIGACILIALAVIYIRKKWIEANYIHLGEHGAVDTANGRTFPLAIAAPVTITEEKDEQPVDRIKQAIDILSLPRLPGL